MKKLHPEFSEIPELCMRISEFYFRGSVGFASLPFRIHMRMFSLYVPLPSVPPPYRCV